MLKQLAATTCLAMAAALAAAPALAQSGSSGSASTPPAGAAASTMPGMTPADTAQQMPGTLRASKLVGLGVYNGSDERIGDINEVLLDRDGKAQAVVIGVGGFLGIGEHDVAVPFAALRWEMASRVPSVIGATPGAAVGQTGGTALPMVPTVAPRSSPTGTAGATAANAPGAADVDRGYPDHAVLPNASRDQLRSAPQFRYGAAVR